MTTRRKLLITLSDTTSNSNDFTVAYARSLKMDVSNGQTYEIGMVSAQIYYTFANISATLLNNQFVYSNGVDTRTLTIPNGQYNITQLNDEVQRQIIGLGDTEANLVLVPNYSTNKVRIELAGGYSVDFTIANSLKDLLGFTAIVVNTTQEGTNIANVSRDVEKILVHCSIANNSSFLNTDTSDTIGEVYLTQPPGSQITQAKNPIIWIPVSNSSVERIDQIRIYFTDQLGRQLDFGGEPTSVSIYIRKEE